MNSEPTDQLKDELSRLVGYACDSILTAEQQTRLNELLALGFGMRAHYLRYVAIHSALTTTAGNQTGSGLEELRDRLALSDEWWNSEPALPGRATVRSLLVRAAAIVLLLTPPAYFVSQWSASTPNVDQRKVTLPVLVGTSAEAEPGASANALAVVPQGKARVSRVAAGTRWPHPNESYTVESIIRPGSRLRLIEGDIELIYDSGVKLLLIGPVDFVLDGGGGKLLRGGLMASVPQAGHGFTIETPNGKVVDLGTEFGVMVDDFGVSEVSVFEGKVEAFPASNSTPRDGKIRLTKGSALQWNNEVIKSLEADCRRLPIALASYTQPDFKQFATEIALSDDFRAQRINSRQWITRGDIRTSAAGLILKGDTNSSAVPYLVTRDQYNPTLGPVTVICEVRFPQITSADVPSFSILTRSASDRSAMDRLWSDVLSTCVRCNYRSATDEIDGLLETATKYERDRELTSLSWRGFRRPQQDVLYRLVMRDDGVNVSFTVAQVDKPSVTKTVICRSLFQGYENHIALEGWDLGAAIVEKLQVYQGQADNRAGNRFARFGMTSDDNDQLRSIAKPNPLRTKISEQARLVLEDDFEEPSIDGDLWSVLGDVRVEKGTAALGRTDAENHIDTFHPRPYLLTRKEFVPAEVNLYVLGKIEFDGNFLQGYGGSFAIMSRCDDKYGEGPEWAISALSTGIRCNLWPAAPQTDHNLEIHEKPTATRLTFLKGSSLTINPHSHSYYFLMEDTGKDARITFQDANDPSIMATIDHRTSADALRGGFVGFESTWGSRVLLDDVQIYLLEPVAVEE
jgi:hypothetical protein